MEALAPATRARRPRAVGIQPRPQLRRARPARLALRRERGAPGAVRRRATRRPARRPRFDELLADEDVEAVVIATPVPTHAELARRALAAGKHVFVEKPMALSRRGGRELVALAEERGLALLPGHLLLYHPGVAQAEGARRLGRARRDPLRLREPPEPRHDPARRERALEPGRRTTSRSSSTSSARSRPSCWARGESFLKPGRRGRRLLLPALPLREGGAHAPLLARPAQDAQDDRRRHREDGRLRRHGARAQGDRLRQGRGAVAPTPTASGARASATSPSRGSPTTSRCGSSASASSRSRAARATRSRRRGTGVAVVRALEQLQASLERERV